jgi:methionyl-tRNA formyltransferase
MDVGDILCQEKIKIDENIIFSELRNNLANLGSKKLVETIENLDNYRKKAIKQIISIDDIKSIKLNKNFGEIDWNDDPRKIYNKWRALESDITSFTILNQKRLIVRGM